MMSDDEALDRLKRAVASRRMPAVPLSATEQWELNESRRRRERLEADRYAELLAADPTLKRLIRHRKKDAARRMKLAKAVAQVAQLSAVPRDLVRFQTVVANKRRSFRREQDAPAVAIGDAAQSALSRIKPPAR